MNLSSPRYRPRVSSPKGVVIIGTQVRNSDDRRTTVPVNSVVSCGIFRMSRKEHNQALPNALGIKSPTAKAKRIHSPRRADKHTLIMSGKGYGPRYQGLDQNGRPVWGDVTAAV